MEAITLTTIFQKAQTTPDGGWHITFAVSQDEADKLIALASLRENLLQLAIVPINKPIAKQTDGLEILDEVMDLNG